MIDDDSANPDGEWIPGGGATSGVDGVNLPSSGQANGGFAEGYYSYPYPYPFAAVAGQDGPAEGFQPPPHLFQHLHPAGYPPFPPWVQPPFDLTGSSPSAGGAASGGTDQVNASTSAAAAANGASGSADSASAANRTSTTNGAAGGSARTSGKKRKHGRKASGEGGSGHSKSPSKRHETAAARALRAAKRAIAPDPNGLQDVDGSDDEHHHHGMNGLDVDLSGVTDPSLLDHDSAHLVTIDPQATTSG